MTTTIYVPGAIKQNGKTKRKRRTKAELCELETAVFHAVKEDRPTTIRHTFYRLVVTSEIDKTESDYRAVARAIQRMCRDKDMPRKWIVDNTRWINRPTTWDGVGAVLNATANAYMRDIWTEQDSYIEVWCESRSAASVLLDVTYPNHVTLVPFGGFSSDTLMYEQADDLREIDKPITIYYFGDYDPSGVWIGEKAHEAMVREGIDITFERVAINEEQIESMELPTRPAKKTDSRAKNWTGGTVELEAIPARTLAQICRECIESHIDPHQLEITRKAEQSEREFLERIAETYSA